MKRRIYIRILGVDYTCARYVSKDFANCRAMEMVFEERGGGLPLRRVKSTLPGSKLPRSQSKMMLGFLQPFQTMQEKGEDIVGDIA